MIYCYFSLSGLVLGSSLSQVNTCQTLFWAQALTGNYCTRGGFAPYKGEIDIAKRMHMLLLLLI